MVNVVGEPHDERIGDSRLQAADHTIADDELAMSSSLRLLRDFLRASPGLVRGEAAELPDLLHGFPPLPDRSFRDYLECAGNWKIRGNRRYRADRGRSIALEISCVVWLDRTPAGRYFCRKGKFQILFSARHLHSHQHCPYASGLDFETMTGSGATKDGSVSYVPSDASPCDPLTFRLLDPFG
jgi:hypothetical protein